MLENVVRSFSFSGFKKETKTTVGRERERETDKAEYVVCHWFFFTLGLKRGRGRAGMDPFSAMTVTGCGEVDLKLCQERLFLNIRKRIFTHRWLGSGTGSSGKW